MNKKLCLVIVLLVIFPALLYGQGFRVGLGKYTGERLVHYSEMYVQDSLIVYEDLAFRASDMLPYIGYRLLDSKRVDLEIGLQHYRNKMKIHVYDWGGYDDSYSSEKYTVVNTNNFELPLMVGFKVLDFKGFSLHLLGNMSLTWSITRHAKITSVPSGADWNQLMVDALNAAETIPRRFYPNYSYGFSLEHGKFGAFFSRYHNMQKSISKGYTLYGETYQFPFGRNIISSRFGLYYRFDLGKKNKTTT